MRAVCVVFGRKAARLGFRRFSMCRVFCALLGLVVGWAGGLAQPKPRDGKLHLSVTEAMYDREAERLQLAIRVFPQDLEAALSQETGKAITVEEPEALAPAALDYFRKHLKIRSNRGAAVALEWGGLDVTKTHVWLFLEAPMAGGTLGAAFHITLMQEVFEDQLNLLQLRDGAMKVALVFSRESGEQVVAPSLPPGGTK